METQGSLKVEDVHHFRTSRIPLFKCQEFIIIVGIVTEGFITPNMLGLSKDKYFKIDRIEVNNKGVDLASKDQKVFIKTSDLNKADIEKGTIITFHLQ